MTALVSIVGMVRSGSTYLEGMLADQTGGIALGELIGTWGAFSRSDLLCACGANATACQFWRRVRDAYPGLDDTETRRYMERVNARMMPVRRVLRWRWRLPSRYTAEAADLFGAVDEAARSFGFPVVVDSSKHPLFYAATRSPRGRFGRHAVVRLVRDPRAVVHSLMSPKTELTRSGGVFAMKGYGLWRAVVFWVVMNEGADRVAPDDAIWLRYEELSDTNTARVVTERVVDGHIGGDGARHQLVANPVRQHGRTGFELDTRWQALGYLRTMAVGLAAWPWLRRYGYPIHPR